MLAKYQRLGQFVAWNTHIIYYIYTHNYPTSTSSSSCFEVQGTWIRDISPTISAVSPASGASSVMPDQGRDHESFRAPGPRFCRAYAGLNSGAPWCPWRPCWEPFGRTKLSWKRLGFPNGLGSKLQIVSPTILLYHLKFHHLSDHCSFFRPQHHVISNFGFKRWLTSRPSLFLTFSCNPSRMSLDMPTLCRWQSWYWNVLNNRASDHSLENWTRTPPSSWWSKQCQKPWLSGVSGDQFSQEKSHESSIDLHISLHIRLVGHHPTCDLSRKKWIRRHRHEQLVFWWSHGYGSPFFHGQQLGEIMEHLNMRFEWSHWWQSLMVIDGHINVIVIVIMGKEWDIVPLREATWI